MVLWKHQSTHNPNMPLRGLLYYSRLLTMLIEQQGLDLYTTAPLSLPTPRYIVFYFGEATRPEQEVMKLSDMPAAGSGDIEMTATVLNCNEGNNTSIMNASETLRGYSRLISLERTLRKDKGLKFREAASQAVDCAIEEGYLVDYLKQHRAEVIDMLFTIQDEERAMRVHEETIVREAKAEGRAEGHQSLAAAMRDCGIEQEKIAQVLSMVESNK